MDKIYVLKKGKFISGPFSLQQLIQNGLKASDKIWYDGLADWKDAASLSDQGVKIISSSESASLGKPSSLFFWRKSS